MNVAVMPYGIQFREDGNVATFPAVFVSFKEKEKHDNETVDAVLLLDSGATITSLPHGDALALGLTLEKGKRMIVRGFGSELIGFRHLVRCTIASRELRIPVVFVNEPDVPRVLGRAGVFDQFTIIFEEVKKRSGFIKKGTPESSTISALLDQ